MAKNTSITLSKHFEDFIAEQVASGRYSSASEVVRDGLRMLERSEKSYGELKEQVAKGVADAKARRLVDFDADSIKKRGKDRLAQRAKSA